MSTTAVIGLSAGKRLLTTSFFCYDVNDKFSVVSDHVLSNYQHAPAMSVITAKKSSNYGPSFPSSNRHKQSVNALKECLDTVSIPSTAEQWPQTSEEIEDENSEMEYSVEALLLLQKSMLEKQWNLSTGQKTRKKVSVVCSGTSARQRRISSKRKVTGKSGSLSQIVTSEQLKAIINPEIRNRFQGYGKGTVSNQRLSHEDVVRLSKKIQVGLSIDKHRLRLEERLGHEPSDKQLAMYLKISTVELQIKLLESSMAREKLATSNIRLVISIAKKYENMGGDMDDLVQGGLIGLMHGIERFDSTKGCRLSTYVYWWIRQGVSKALNENSTTMKLPSHLYERLNLIREATAKLQEQGITPSVKNIAKCLNMTEKKVKNGTMAMKKIISLDREAFPSLNGIPGDTMHNYFADPRPEHDPWYAVQKWALKEEINKILNIALGEREREIIILYYGLNGESLTWEEISKRMGLSRERVRQVGLVALEKLKHAARKRKLEALLVMHN
uniref:Sigma factor n=1 Tax=Monsonia emarginata TaxID=28966 RepID=A0A0G2SWR8_9ROSI|nr:sigma factor [Monsonia emarginata]